MSDNPGEDSFEEMLAEMRRLGTVTYANWTEYTWKNELTTHASRAIEHLSEIVQETECDYSPNQMLERALSLAAFSMRRLIECRLVTDKLRDETFTVCEIRRLGSSTTYREPFKSHTGGNFFENFDMKCRHKATVGPKAFADRIIHARIIAVLAGSVYLPDGFLIASDHQMGTALFHLTPSEFISIVDKFLNDQIALHSDRLDPETGKTYAERLDAKSANKLTRE